MLCDRKNLESRVKATSATKLDRELKDDYSLDKLGFLFWEDIIKQVGFERFVGREFLAEQQHFISLVWPLVNKKRCA